MKTIAETAWHHQGDIGFMRNLVENICEKTECDIVKLHITLNLDEYIDKSHPAYKILEDCMLGESEWRELAGTIRHYGKELMLLVNDIRSAVLAGELGAEYIEIHSVCLNDVHLLDAVKEQLSENTKLVLGVGGTELNEIEHALKYIGHENVLLMFGFQNYPTVLEDVNLSKIKRVMRLFEGYDFGYADHTAWNSAYNELVTLLVAASGVNYIEKHVTTNYGEERMDWQSAVSIDMFNSLVGKLAVFNRLTGNGCLELNTGEQNYSKFGPMKKAGIYAVDLKEGDVLKKNDLRFVRTGEKTETSQLEVVKLIGKVCREKRLKGSFISKADFI